MRTPEERIKCLLVQLPNNEKVERSIMHCVLSCEISPILRLKIIFVRLTITFCHPQTEQTRAGRRSRNYELVQLTLHKMKEPWPPGAAADTHSRSHGHGEAMVFLQKNQAVLNPPIEKILIIFGPEYIFNQPVLRTTCREGLGMKETNHQGFQGSCKSPKNWESHPCPQLTPLYTEKRLQQH
jgi:hypothetical protein